jgi:hypothetical protein
MTRLERFERAALCVRRELTGMRFFTEQARRELLDASREMPEPVARLVRGFSGFHRKRAASLSQTLAVLEGALSMARRLS